MPSTLIVEGVLPGSDGSLLYRTQDYRNRASDWNDKPVLLNHPYANGRPTTAATPGVFDRQGLGIVKNVRIDGNGSLTAEVWLDAAKCQKTAPEALNAIENGEALNFRRACLRTKT